VIEIRGREKELQMRDSLFQHRKTLGARSNQWSVSDFCNLMNLHLGEIRAENMAQNALGALHSNRTYTRRPQGAHLSMRVCGELWGFLV
jgi:hypothetical protein